MMNLPAWVATQPLIGNPSQVKWGKSIRAKHALALQKMTPRVILLAIRPAISEKQLQAAGCSNAQTILKAMHAACKYALSCPDAVWWILHRDEKTHTWIAPAWKVCMEHFARNPLK